MKRVSKLHKVKNIEIDKSKGINKNNVADYILSMNSYDITYDFVMSTFGKFNDENICNAYDLLEVPAGTFEFTDYDGKKKSNKNIFTTTVGLYLFNLFMRDLGLSKLFNGYINYTLTDGTYGDIETAVAYALIEDDIDTEQVKNFCNTIQWFMPFEDVLSANHTEKLMGCTKIINKRKAELVKKYAKELEAGDVKVVEDMEKELLALAKDYLKDDPSMDTINSGAGSSFGNNFKNNYVMKGAIRNPDPYSKREYDIVTSNLIDGVSANEYSILAGSGVNGAYSRGKLTENGGYYEKLFIYALQYLKLGPKDSDCGTKNYIVETLDKKKIKNYMYSYIIKNNGELELLTSKNKDKYIDKTVKIRFTSMCKYKDGFCNKCAGELLYMQSEKIGLIVSQIPDTLKLRCMKGFHDSTVKTTGIGKDVDPMKIFYPNNY